MRVLIACAYSGVLRDEFIKAGHQAMSCDLLETELPGPHYKGDIRDLFEFGAPVYDLMIAHPPCTRLTNSGVRWLHTPPKGKTLDQMWLELDDGAKFYNLIKGLPVKKKAIENPIMHKYAKERIQIARRQIVQPWWFGDKQLKATGWELFGLPDLIPTDKLTPPKPGTEEHKEWSSVHLASPGPNRWKDRSRTLPGSASAMAQQWGCEQVEVTV